MVGQKNWEKLNTINMTDYLVIILDSINTLD